MGKGTARNLAVKRPSLGTPPRPPLLALVTQTPLALGEADTNAMRFRTGHPDPTAFIERLEEEGVRRLVIRTSLSSVGGPSPVGVFWDSGVQGLRSRWFRAGSRFRLELKGSDSPLGQTSQAVTLKRYCPTDTV